jgi:Ca2+-binding RTX toxin-like protein
MMIHKFIDSGSGFMATVQAYNAWGVGFRMSSTGSVAGANSESTLVSTTPLGSSTYLFRYDVSGSAFTSATVIAVDGVQDDYMRVATWFRNGQIAFQIRDINLAVSQLAIGGLSAFLSGDDRIFGNGFSDRIIGFNGNDLLYGNGSNDTLSGSSGNDYLSGGIGNDYLYGGADNDRLFGGVGNDTLSGSAGADRFVYNSADGADVITGFRDGVDHIEIKMGAERFSQVRVTDSGTDTIIRFGTVKITLEHFDHRLIGSADFIFS